MEVHELLGLPKRVEDLTEAELSSHLAKFFPATRPRTPISALITRAETTMKSVASAASANPPANVNPTAAAEAAKMAAAMAKLGLDPQGKPLPKKSSGKGSLL